MTYVNEGSVLAIAIIFLLLGTVAVIARFYARQRKNIGFGVDDWLCLPALAMVIADCILMIIGSVTHTVGSHSPSGLGTKYTFYGSADQTLLQKLQFSFSLIQIVALANIKLSILFFYRRIFRGRLFNIASWVLIFLVIIWAAAFLITRLAACGTSIAANWQTLRTLRVNCVNTFAIMIALTATDVVVDLALLTIPIPLVLALQMSLRRKITVICNLMVGTLAIACGGTRMIIFTDILGPPLFSRKNVTGLPWDDGIGFVSQLMFWGMLEIGVAIIAICLPMLRPLFHGWSSERIFIAIRSAISLDSMGSTYKASSSTRRDPGKSESEAAITGVPQAEGSGVGGLKSMDVEVYGMGKISEDTYLAGTADVEGIWRETVIVQSSKTA